jgi:hypothetical protein
MGRASRSGRRPNASSPNTERSAGRRARVRAGGARGKAGTVHWLEMTGAMDATIAALELEVRRVARRYDAEIEDFQVKVRRRSG